MKLSEILKKEHGAAAPPRVQVSEPRVRTPADFTPPLPPPLKPTPPAKELDTQLLETQLREKLEKEFESKLIRITEALELKFRHQWEEERNKQDQREAEKRADVDKRQWQESQILREREAILELQKKMEAQFLEQFQRERANLEKRFQEQMEDAQKNVQGMSDLIKTKDDEIQNLKKLLKPLLPSASKEKMPQVQPEAPNLAGFRAEQLQETILPSGPIPEVKVPEAPPVEVPSDKEGSKEAVPAAETLVNKTYYAASPEWELKAKTLRDYLVKMGGEVFEQCLKRQGINVEPLRAELKKLIQMLAEREAEFLSVAIEPYADPAIPFHYHAANVAILSLILSLEFEFSDEERLDLGLSAFLHDVGLLSVQEDLNYPKQLTPELQQEVLNHPARGAEILAEVLSPSALEAIMQHHEVGNGKGYPKGLQHQQIHIFAHIIHVVDSFEALIHERPYRKTPLEVNEAMKQLIDTGRGIYERTVLKSLMVRIGLYPVMTYVELNNKKIARVVRQNREFPLSPVVRIEFDETGVKQRVQQVVDLSTTQFIHIIGPIRKEVAEFPRSHFAATETEEKREWTDVLMNIIPFALILLVIVVALFAIIKI